MDPADLEYYRYRAATERALSKAAGRANVSAIHEELARQYEALVQHAELRPPPSEVVHTTRGLASADQD